MTTTLHRRAKAFISALDELGFGDNDTPVSGADTVDVICHYESLLRKLPALAELADAAEAYRRAINPEVRLRREAEMFEALNELKEKLS